MFLRDIQAKSGMVGNYAIVSLLTSYVVDRVEADAKFANFKGIFSFHALLHVLNTLPVSVSERSVIVGHQGRALESS